jgi:UDPglucose 6-dehydrogenase
MKIGVFGAGYVGLVTAACLSESGHRVVCVDVDAARVAELARGILPIHEPGLDGIVERNLQGGRLSFTVHADEAVVGSDVIFLAVGTPAAEDGSADLEHVLRAAGSIAAHIVGETIVVTKSTVPVGTAALVRRAIDAGLRQRAAIVPFAVVSNPEFLQEGAAVGNFVRPDRVVVGCDDERAARVMHDLYAPFLCDPQQLIVMDVRSAELTKYVANAMLATRVSFMNEMALLAERLGADIEMVRQGVGSDPRIGRRYLQPGCGWGGSCLPKDMKALARMGEQVGLPLSIVHAVQSVNDAQQRLLAERVVVRFGDDLRGRCFALWGLAFKPGTDDLREAPSRALIDALLTRGARVHAYDPVAMPAYRKHHGEREGLTLAASAYDAVEGADALLLVTEWRQFNSPDLKRLALAMRGRVVFDGRNLYDPAVMRDAGFEHVSIGRAAVPGVRRLRRGRRQAVAA